MIGLWCHKLKQNLASLGAGEAVDLDSSSSAAAVSQPSSSVGLPSQLPSCHMRLLTTAALRRHLNKQLLRQLLRKPHHWQLALGLITCL